ncbi:MAG: TA system VapC family ribonuclease toxin, partial [Terriglobales bacterium]
MIVPDANLLIYAYQEDSPFHSGARRWLEDLLSGAEAVGLAWAVILAFLRVATDPRILTRPAEFSAAAQVVGDWLGFPHVRVVAEPAGHWPELRALLANAQVRGPAIMDGHLAALTIAYGAVLHTHDRGFA